MLLGMQSFNPGNHVSLHCQAISPVSLLLILQYILNTLSRVAVKLRFACLVSRVAGDRVLLCCMSWHWTLYKLATASQVLRLQVCDTMFSYQGVCFRGVWRCGMGMWVGAGVHIYTGIQFAKVWRWEINIEWLPRSLFTLQLRQSLSLEPRAYQFK